MKIYQDIYPISKPSQIFAILPFYSGDVDDGFRFGGLGRWYGLY